MKTSRNTPRYSHSEVSIFDSTAKSNETVGLYAISPDDSRQSCTANFRCFDSGFRKPPHQPRLQFARHPKLEDVTAMCCRARQHINAQRAVR